MVMAQPQPPPESTPKRKPRKSRAKGLRTTTGCTVCRQRHLKCGEEKPQCGNCARGGRDCVYGPARSETQSSLNPQNLTISDKENDTSTVDETEPNAILSNIEDDFDINREVTADGDNINGTTTVAALPVYSPLSTLSSSASIGPETGPIRWFNIVANDFQENQQASGAFASIFDQASPNNQLLQTGSGLAESLNQSLDTTSAGFNFRSNFNFRYSPRTLHEDLPPWHSEVTLREDEVPILENFCKHIADWLDVIDPKKNFASAIPQLAMYNEGLMKAILALSARHMSLRSSSSDQLVVEQAVALQYYHDTLQYLHNAMKHSEYLKSIEVNATSLILSTYEMIDGMGRGWIRHLKGVFWIQRSQDTSADSGGLKAAIWWAWLRQDTWAALREKRKVLTIYKPVIPICDLRFWEHANFVSFLFALCVSYMSEEKMQVEGNQLQERIDRARTLSSALDEWYSFLRDNFKVIPLLLPGYQRHGHIRPVWINPPPFGVVIQTYHAAKVILLAHAPAVNGVRELNLRNKQLLEAVDIVCGIAMTIKDGGSSFISTSCLWACGLCVQDDLRREVIIDLVREHKKIAGWPDSDLGNELQQEWASWT